MNNFHRFQNLFSREASTKSEKREKEEFSAIFEFVFTNLIEKATHVTLFWNLSRNLDKISSKIRRKIAKFDEKNDKNQKLNIQ